jgi:3-phosphoshikimate 1-carboxyvinyltransferase
MIAVVASSILSGSINIPTSKSAMQRACALSLLTNGTTIIYNPGKSNDDLAALDIIEKLGATIEHTNNQIKIISNGEIHPPSFINCNESGLSLRMFTPIIAISNDDVTISGTGSLMKRPIDLFSHFFAELGVSIKSVNGFLPVDIKGPLQPVDIEIDGSKSSQYLTGLLFAFAKKVDTLTVINVRNLVSKPYIDLSIQLLNHFGYKVVNENYQRFLIYPTTSINRNITYTVEGDWSSASFFIVAALVAGDLALSGLDLNSFQSDRKILEALDQINADYSFNSDVLKIKKSSAIKPFEFDATDCPDLFPPLVVLALAANGTSVIKGVKRLYDKESNRAEALMNQFSKLRADIFVIDDNMVINGGKKLNGGIVNSQHDHRIAMALAIAGLIAESEVVIEDAESVNKSFPDFFNLLQNCGGLVTLKT